MNRKGEAERKKGREREDEMQREDRDREVREIPPAPSLCFPAVHWMLQASYSSQPLTYNPQEYCRKNKDVVLVKTQDIP